MWRSIRKDPDNLRRARARLRRAPLRWRRRTALGTCLLAACAAALALAGGAPAQLSTGGCPGATSADAVAQRPGPPLRFGITPGVQTGQLATGSAPPRTPEDPGQQSRALARLVPSGVPFVLRLHRFFWSDGEQAIQRFAALAQRYTAEGYLVELQLRYHPSASQEGDIGAWTAFVREVVDRFSANPRVVAIQVTNEVNLTESPDSSDGAYRGSRDALIQGVIAAKDEARRRGNGQLQVGFNWAYRADPSSDQSFWAYLRDHGGQQLRSALDWVGLDAYPGSFFPPAEPPGRERDGMVNALSSLRCYAQGAGIPDVVPVHIEENGYPTSPSPDRSYARQAQVLENLVRTVNDYRGTFNVSDYRWFDLRDSDSTSPNFQQQYGLMTDTYAEKPAFGVFRRLIGELSVKTSQAGAFPPGSRSTPVRAGRPRLVLRLTCTRRGALAAVLGADARAVKRVALLIGRRLVATGRRAPFSRLLVGRRGIAKVRAMLVLRDGRRVSLQARLGACRFSTGHPVFTG